MAESINSQNCLYSELAEYFPRESHSSLSIVYPHIPFHACAECGSKCSLYEEVPQDFDDIVFGIVRVVNGVGENLEFPENTQARKSLKFRVNNPRGYSTASGRSLNLSKKLPGVRMEELTGNSRLDSMQIKARLRQIDEHSTDYAPNSDNVDDEIFKLG